MDKEKFTEYLLSIGFRNNGAAEIIRRLETNRAGTEDIRLLERFLAAERGK